MRNHRPPQGFLRRLRAGLFAFALILASTTAIGQAPATAACIHYWHTTWHEIGNVYYSTWQWSRTRALVAT